MKKFILSILKSGGELYYFPLLRYCKLYRIDNKFYVLSIDDFNSVREYLKLNKQSDNVFIGDKYILS